MKAASRTELLAEVASLQRQLEDLLFLLPDALVDVAFQNYQVTYLNRMARILFGY